MSPVIRFKAINETVRHFDLSTISSFRWKMLFVGCSKVFAEYLCVFWSYSLQFSFNQSISNAVCKMMSNVLNQYVYNLCT